MAATGKIIKDGSTNDASKPVYVNSNGTLADVTSIAANLLPFSILNTNATQSGLGVRPTLYEVSKNVSLNNSIGWQTIGTFTTSMTNTSVFAAIILQVVSGASIKSNYMILIPKTSFPTDGIISTMGFGGATNTIEIKFTNSTRKLEIYYHANTSKTLFYISGFIFTNNTWTPA